MNELLALLQKGLAVVERFRSLEVQMPNTVVVVFGILLAFGLLNCFLGYRLMRFWMMLAGLAVGAILSIAVMYYLLNLPTQDRRTYLFGALAAGAVLAVISFLFYRAGIFILVAGLSIALGIYVIHPNSSLSFFLCLLLGVLLGVGAMRFDREFIVVLTSLFGGVLGGYSLARLLRLPELPYGLLLCAGFALLGMLVQFVSNRRGGAGPKTEPEEGLTGQDEEEMPGKETPETSLARRREQERANEEFYEEYFHGGDVFDRTTKEIRHLTGEPTEETDIHLMAWNQKKRRHEEAP